MNELYVFPYLLYMKSCVANLVNILLSLQHYSNTATTLSPGPNTPGLSRNKRVCLSVVWQQLKRGQMGKNKSQSKPKREGPAVLVSVHLCSHVAGDVWWTQPRQKQNSHSESSKATKPARPCRSGGKGGQWAGQTSSPAWSHLVCVGSPVGSGLFSCRYCTARPVCRRPIVLHCVPWLSAISAGQCLKPPHYGVALLALLYLPRRLFAFSDVSPATQTVLPPPLTTPRSVPLSGRRVSLLPPKRRLNTTSTDHKFWSWG